MTTPRPEAEDPYPDLDGFDARTPRPEGENRWERLRDLPPAEEAASHFSDADDPLGISDLICAGCQDDWPCDFERGRRSVPPPEPMPHCPCTCCSGRWEIVSTTLRCNGDCGCTAGPRIAPVPPIYATSPGAE